MTESDRNKKITAIVDYANALTEFAVAYNNLVGMAYIIPDRAIDKLFAIAKETDALHAQHATLMEDEL